MKSSVKVRSKHPIAVIPRVEDGPGVNDNVPAMLPGHELSDLEGVPRQPAAESVAYYNRVTLIESFPAHPSQEPDEAAEVPAMEAKRDAKAGRMKTSRGPFSLVCICSLLFHATVFAALLFIMPSMSEPPPDDESDIAGDTISVIMLGDSTADQQSAGKETKDLDPEPEQVTAEAVQPDTVQPTEAEPEEAQPVSAQSETEQTPPQETAEAVQPTETAETAPAQPNETQPVQPAQPDVQEISPQVAVTPEPEVVTSATPAETAVVQPEATQIPDTVQPTPVQPAEQQPAIQPIETAEVPPEQTVTPVEKLPVPKPPVEKRKDVVKKEPPKRVKVRSGSNGDGDQDSRKGSAQGTETAQSDADSQVAAQRTGTGTANEAHYNGQLGASLYRCLQRLPNRLREGGTTISIVLVVDGSANVTSVRAKSGIPELDAASVSVISSCRVPPLPPEMGRSKVFRQPVQIPE
jgi:protein TonB